MALECGSDLLLDFRLRDEKNKKRKQILDEKIKKSIGPRRFRRWSRISSIDSVGPLSSPRPPLISVPHSPSRVSVIQPPSHLKIKVFVYVMAEDTELITDDNIRSKLENLNKDFNGLNENYEPNISRMDNYGGAHTSLLRQSIHAWQSLRKSPEIEFTLEYIRPIKTRPNQFFNPFIDSMHPGLVAEAVYPEMNTWNSLNIWVCELRGMAGFGEFPILAPQDPRDGVGVSPEAFMDPNDRTLTHEIGHWLNCHHPWSGLFGDQVGPVATDVPVSPGPLGGNPLNDPNIMEQCVYENGDALEMFLNYMNYFDDACLCMFTRKQVEIMRQTIRLGRSGLYRY